MHPSHSATPLLRQAAIAIVAIAWCLTAAPASAATVLSDNLSQAPFPDPLQSSNYSPSDQGAQGFTTTLNGHILDSVTLKVGFMSGSNTTGYVDVWVYDQSGTGGRPGASVGAKLGRINATPNIYKTFFDATLSGLARTLSPDTSYYLVSAPGGFASGEGYIWVFTESEAGIGFPSPWSQNQGSGWSETFLNYPNQMRIEATGVPEIDPAGCGSVVAFLTGALGLIERRRLQAKAA